MKIIPASTLTAADLDRQRLRKLKPEELTGVLATLDAEAQTTFVTRFNATWSTFDPQTRKRMLGGAAGGALAGSAAAAALSVRQISQLFGNRPVFLIASTVLGTTLGVLAPDVLKHVQSGKLDWESPSWWSVVFGKAKIQAAGTVQSKPLTPTPRVAGVSKPLTPTPRVAGIPRVTGTPQPPKQVTGLKIKSTRKPS